MASDNNYNYASLKGKRYSNEDQHYICVNQNETDKKKEKINIYCIFDGHGGKKVSAIASQIIPYYLTVKNKDLCFPLKKEYVVKIFTLVQKIIEKKIGAAAKNMGSTCLNVMHFKQGRHNYLDILNLGDCRCVISRDNLAIPLTKDHKPHWPDERRRIEKLGGEIYYDGTEWRVDELSVSRALGDSSSDPYVSHYPDIYHYKLTKYDDFLVLACDGLWDVMSNQDVVNYIIDRKKDKDLAKSLANYAINNKGSTDNITIIIVYFC
jgi:serine/threonine protein phosphatase PrpC